MLVGLCMVLSGCAAIPPDKVSPSDPWESFNRGVFDFNQTADQWVIKPVATGYAEIMPLMLRKSISNFFNSLDDLKVLANDILQLKFKHAGDTTGRLLLNTTVGFFGFFDPAGEFGVRKRDQDFGQTLGFWGFESGPYLVLPFLGSSTLRDGVGLVADSQIKKLPFDQIEHDSTRDWAYYGSYGLNILNLRAELLGAEKLLDTAATDPYIFMRSAYLQKRQALINGETSKKPAVTDQELFD
jgi:phospholipid-binding lipoprotein MlaA